MSWAIGFDPRWQRDVGYGVPAECDQPGCYAKIDRGLAYICGGEMYGGETGCGLFFCRDHQSGRHQLCERCLQGKERFAPTADASEWISHKLTDESWQEWRDASPIEVERLRAL